MNNQELYAYDRCELLQNQLERSKFYMYNQELP